MHESETRIRNFLALYLPFVDRSTPEGEAWVRKCLTAMGLGEGKIQAFMEDRLYLPFDNTLKVDVPPPTQVGPAITIKKTRRT